VPNESGLIANRIVGFGDVPPDQLLANPANFRRHPGAQLDALRGSLRELGWLKQVIVNRATGYVLDGHARVEEALRQGVATVPVLYVELSPQEEKLALVALDPITEMATRDDAALTALIAEVSTEDPGLTAMLRQMTEDAGTALLDRAGPDEGPIPERWQVVVECASEADQKGLLDRFLAEGLECRALT